MRIFGYLAKKVGDLTIKYSNFPESYVKRSYEQVYWKNPSNYPQYTKAQIARKKYRFTMNRPWTGQFKMQNERNVQRKKVFVEPVGEWTFFKGDRVEIMVGRDKGKQGIISQVIQERNWVVVEGLNTHIRMVGKDKKKNFPGIALQSEAPLLVTTGVKLVDPETLKATDVEWRYTEEGDKVRVSMESSRIIPIPKSASETIDYKSKELYLENAEKDTTASVVTEVQNKKEVGIQSDNYNWGKDNNVSTQTPEMANEASLQEANRKFDELIGQELNNVPVVKRRQIMFEIIRIIELRSS